MRRRYVVLLACAALILFLVVSALLARVFSADGAEQSAITGLVQAEARGDSAAMLSRIKGCTASDTCRTGVVDDAAALTRPGAVSIIQFQPSTSFSLGTTLGTARVAWKTPSSLPIVQCVRVRHAGNAISGLRVELLALTPRIPSDADCPAQI